MMLNWPIVILCAVGISILLTVVIIPRILFISHRKGLWDRPGGRKVHSGHIPRLGGFSFLPVLIITMSLLLLMPAASSTSLWIDEEFGFSSVLPEVVVLLGAMTIMFLVGLYDDLRGLNFIVKFTAQIIVAVLIVEGGSYIIDYQHLLGIGTTSHALGKVITGFLIVYIINSFNLIDGIDGLAAGLGLISLCFFGVVFFDASQFIYSLMCWVMAGTVWVFWMFNVFGSNRLRTKIFMGDIGSLTLGVFVAFMAIRVANLPSSDFVGSPRTLVLSLSTLVIPLLDVVRVFFIRIVGRRNPFKADKIHIHHILLNAGVPMKLAMAVIVAVQIGLLAVNLGMATHSSINLILIVDVLIYALCVGVPYCFRRNRSLTKSENKNRGNKK